jgi:4-amino-4-deoxy-L-arabinose transferase-like glycosyltransferase
VLVGIITVGGLVLRLPTFSDSLSGDEISTYFIVTGHSLGRVLRLVESNQETSPPLYFMLAWATKGLLGNPAQSIRLVSLVTGTAAIPLTFVLGMWTVGRRAALVGATCVACSASMIFYSTAARPFTLVLFLTLLSTLALVRVLDRGGLGWWVAYAAFSCGAAYTHYTAVFFLVVQLAWAFWTQPQVRKHLIMANGAAALAYIPWINGLREDLHAPNFIALFEPFNLHTIFGVLETTSIGHPIIPIDSLPGTFIAAVAAAGLAIGAIGLILKARGAGEFRWRPKSRVTLIALLALAPACLELLYSWRRADIFLGQSLVASWPGLALAIGVIVTRPARPLRIAAAALTLGAYAFGGVMMLGSAAQTPNIDQVVAYIDRVGTNRDPIVSMSLVAHPLSEVDVALADGAKSDHLPVLRLGSPSLSEELATMSGPSPQPVLFGLPVAPPQEVAAQAVALARHGTIFLISYVRIPDYGSSAEPKEVREFLNALPTRFHVTVAPITYSGFSRSFLGRLYVIRDTGLSH